MHFVKQVDFVNEAFNTELAYNEQFLEDEELEHVGDEQFKFKKLDAKELKRLRELETKLEKAMPKEVPQPKGTPWDDAVAAHEKKAQAGRRKMAKKAVAATAQISPRDAYMAFRSRLVDADDDLLDLMKADIADARAGRALKVIESSDDDADDDDDNNDGNGPGAGGGAGKNKRKKAEESSSDEDEEEEAPPVPKKKKKKKKKGVSTTIDSSDDDDDDDEDAPAPARIFDINAATIYNFDDVQLRGPNGVGTDEFDFLLGVLNRKFEVVGLETGVAIVAKEPLRRGDRFWDPTAPQLSVKPVDAAPGRCLERDVGAFLQPVFFELGPLDGSADGLFALSCFIDQTDGAGVNAKFATRANAQGNYLLGVDILEDVATGAKVLVGSDNMRKKRPVPEAWSSDEEEAPPLKKKKAASKKRKSTADAEAPAPAPARKKAKKKKEEPSPGKLARAKFAKKAAKRTKKK